MHKLTHLATRLARHLAPRLAIAAASFAFASSSHAADWSDTAIGFRTGNKFAEPFGVNDIKKNIVNFSHASGYSLGSNFFNADFLMSDAKDPAGAGSSNGAQEVYIVYRHTLSLEKLGAGPLKFGPVRGLGITFGFDVNAKTDAGYNSKKRMLVAGPTVQFDVPGFFDLSLLVLRESNAPYNTFTRVSTPRYTYKTHPMLTAAWGIPFGKSGFSFEGFANLIASKGKNEFGGDTAAETNIDAQIMYDLGSLAGAPGKFKIGFEYQYWKNKFGNDAGGPAGKGAFAKTAMFRAEYHF